MKQFLKGFQKGLKDFGHGITAIVNSVLLSIVYFIGAGITSMVAKITGKHFLDMKKRRESYWSDLNLKKKPKEDYYRQF